MGGPETEETAKRMDGTTEVRVIFGIPVMNKVEVFSVVLGFLNCPFGLTFVSSSLLSSTMILCAPDGSEVRVVRSVSDFRFR